MALTIRWEITNTCNLKCKHCFNRSGPKSKIDVSLADKVLVLQKLASLEQDIDLGFSGGESMHAPDFWSLVDVIQKDFPHIHITNFLTNGTYLTPDNILRFQARGLDPLFTISLDSDYIRGRGFNKRLHKNIAALGKYHMRFNTKTTVCDKDIKKIYDVYKYVMTTSAIGIIINPVNVMGRWQDYGFREPDPKTFCDVAHTLFFKHIQEIQSKTLSIDPFFMLVPNTKGLTQAYLCSDVLQYSTSGCHEILIKPNGTITKCLYNWEEQSSQRKNIVLQSIRDCASVFVTPCSHPYQCQPDDIILRQNEQCVGCKYWSLCKAGMGLYRKNNNGFKDDYACMWFKHGYWDDVCGYFESWKPQLVSTSI